ncbi:hypothetical protein S245_054777 [Arachis hypogaea]
MDLFIQVNVAHSKNHGKRKHHKFSNKSNFGGEERFGFRGRGSRSGGFRRGGRFLGTRIFCQLCNKPGHTAVQCQLGMMKDQIQGALSPETMIIGTMMQEALPIHQIRGQDHQGKI